MKGKDPADTATGIWLLWGDATHMYLSGKGPSNMVIRLRHIPSRSGLRTVRTTLTFAYGDLTGSLTAYNYTVGMENGNGTAGSSYYYVKDAPPVGTAPAVWNRSQSE